MSSRLASLFLAILFLATDARSGIIEKTINFEQPLLENSGIGLLISVKGCRTIGHPGEPMVPVYPARFLLPPNEIISKVTIVPLDTVNIANTRTIVAMPHQYPLGTTRILGEKRNDAIYRSTSHYPKTSGILASEQISSGMNLAFVNIYPCRIIPSTGSITFASAVHITIETKPSGRPYSRLIRARHAKNFSGINTGIENPEIIEKFISSSSSPGDPGDGFETIPYIIITSTDLASSFEPLAQLKKTSGLNTEIVTTDWISSNFSGEDIQARIRNFIIHAWNEWQAEFILLGGDEEIIPHRSMYVKVGSEIEPDIASDLYYAALDGNWNSDGDAYFGEPGEEDLIPEVCVGRLPADTPEHVANFISKLTIYSVSPPADKCTTALMLGELLWDDVVTTWGADSKDEILYGSSNFGFTTTGIPESFDSYTLYDRDLGSWNKNELLAYLNNGINLVNHLGHSNLHSVMRLPIWDIPLLENSGPDKLPFICYSQGCYPASFDNRDDAGTILADDAIGEQLVTGPAGAVAFIGNTRLGWSSPGTTSGVAQYFDRQFFDAMFGEGFQTLGEIFDDSRIDNISYISYAAIRYTMYEMCLLGDPAMNVWTDTPAELSVEHDNIVFAEDGLFRAEVTNQGIPVNGARVSLLSEDLDSYYTTFTNTSGVAYLKTTPDFAGVAILSVTASNYYVYTDTIPVVFSSESHLSLLHFILDDDSIGISNGDGDGIIECGEIVELFIAVKNDGSSTAFDAKIVLSCDDPYIYLSTDTFLIGDMPQRALIFIENEISIGLGQNIPNGHSFHLDMNILASGLQWNSSYEFIVSAPGITLQSWALTDTLHGDGDGCLEAWEYLGLSTTWINNGNTDIIAPVLTLSCPAGDWSRVIKKSECLPDIPVGNSVDSEGILEIFVRELTPPFSDITLYLRLEAENIPAWICTLTTTTCGSGISDHVTGEIPWKHSAITGYDGWHISTEQSVSSPSSWKCGSHDGSIYPNMMDAALVTPPLCLYENSILTFQHRMEAEATTVYPYWAQDAGVVEISSDGGETWTIINPTVNYPCRASATNTIFLSPYQRCYSGNIDWKTETFNLSAWHGPVLLRFHFATNEQYAYSGWFIDDIQISTEQLTDVDDNIPPVANINALHSIYPNPFNPSTTIKYEVAGRSNVAMTIYDVTGRHIRTLLNEAHEKGLYDITWNGRDNKGSTVSSGVYFCRIRIGIYTATKRLVLLR